MADAAWTGSREVAVRRTGMGEGTTDLAPATVVRTAVDGPVGRVLLDRPAAMNAITVELGRQLEQALVGLAAVPTVRVIVIRGAGGNFSVGGDVTEVERLRAGGPETLAPLFANFARACAVIAELSVPVVAAVEGYAMAGGFELMQSCDLVVVRDDARLADNHINVAMVPGGGGSQKLPRLAGRQRALAHILTGDRLSGRDAVEWGLAYRSAPADSFDATVDDLVARLTVKDPATLARAKRLVIDGLALPLDEGLAMERAAVVAHLAGGTGGEGVADFIRRRSST